MKGVKNMRQKSLKRDGEDKMEGRWGAQEKEEEQRRKSRGQQ